MADEERSLLDKILKPTRTESKDFNTILDKRLQVSKVSRKIWYWWGFKKDRGTKRINKTKRRV